MYVHRRVVLRVRLLASAGGAPLAADEASSSDAFPTCRTSAPRARAAPPAEKPACSESDQRPRDGGLTLGSAGFFDGSELSLLLRPHDGAAGGPRCRL